MRIRLNIIAFFSIAGVLINGCTKQETDPLQDVRPEIPITVTNAIDFRLEPTVGVSLKDSIININLAIPDNKGRTIKEITKIAASTSPAKVQATGTTGFYPGTPIAVNATTYSFSTTIKQYFSIYPVSASNPKAAANVELGNRFYFLITLDDDTKLISEPIRVLVLE